MLFGFFGVGSWRHGKTPPDMVEKEGEIAYELKDANSTVINDGAMVTVGELLEKKLADNPNAVFKYFKIQPEPRDGCPGWFSLGVRNHIYWKINNYTTTDKEVKPKFAASLLPPHTFRTEHTDLLWQLRWTTSGFTPVAPSAPLTPLVPSSNVVLKGA